jgi:hypothetical protein
MARIKIEDLPADQKISKEEMKKVMGGVYTYSWASSLPVPLPSPSPDYSVLQMISRPLTFRRISYPADCV